MSTTTDKKQEAPEAGVEWGASDDLNALEALMWRAEADPRLRSTMIAVEELDCVPDWDRLLAAHDWGSRLIPRFRQKVTEPAMGVGRPMWVTDRDFDLNYHVRRMALPGDGTWSDLLRTVEQMAMTPFDKARPPWEAALIEGLPGGKAAYALKLHHSTTDGIGATQLLAQLHSRQREPNPNKPQRPAPEAADESAVSALARQAVGDARGLGGGLVGAAGRGLGALRRPDRALGETLRYVASMRRMLADPDAAPSPLLSGRSMSWRFLAFDVAFADLRGASKAHGASLNDAFVAALMGGFRRYHEAMGQPIERMPIAIPISVRKSDDAAGGNAFAGARLAGPVGIEDPVKRMADIGAQVKAARDEPAINGLGAVAPALSRLPGPLIAQISGGMTKGNDLQASNVPGIREEVYIAGAKIERAYPFAPLPGCAAMITLVSHGDMCCIGANLDAAAITDIEAFSACLAEGFEEVLALKPGAGPVVRRV